MKRISTNKVSDIQYFNSKGYSIRKIANETGVSKSTIGRILSKEDEKSDENCGGRSKLLADRTEFLVLKKFEIGEFKTRKDACKFILDTNKIKVSKSTITNLLHKAGMKSYARPKKPRLLPRHKKARYSFAKGFRVPPDEFWRKVVFTDESKFNLFGPDGNKRVWRFPGSMVQDHHVQQVVKFGGGSVMVWGAITYDGVGRLLRVDGRMNASQYVDILESGLKSTLSNFDKNLNDIIFQQDHDPKHDSNLARQWFINNNVNMLPYPSCSADMNIIEHVWNDIDIRLRNLPEQPKTHDELWNLVENLWYSTSLDYIHNLYDSMKIRINALYKVKGSYTKY